ncbi:MAG: NAD(P)/FAD-dependent oxidoreductase [Betaproteobacteria bacterium]
MTVSLPSDTGVQRPRTIAVIGAGPAGMAAALFLHRAGHRVTLFERVDVPVPVGAGLLLQPTGLQVLDRLGLGGQIDAVGARVERLHGTTQRGRTVLDLRYATRNGAAEHGMGIHRGALCAALWHAIQKDGIAMHPGRSVARVRQSDQSAQLRLAGRTYWEDFELVVVADGTFSQLRTQIPVPHTVSVYPWGAWWAILADPERRFDGVLRQTFRSASRMLGIMPIGQSPGAAHGVAHVTLFWSVRRRDEAQLRAKGVEAWKEEVLALDPAAAPLVAQVERTEQLVFATYADVRMYPWHHGRIVVIGDAAHATSPQLGQGANLGLVDAAVLADLLARHLSARVALAAYSKIRRSHLTYYQRASSLLTPIFQSDSQLLPMLRDTFMGAVCRMPGARGAMLSTLTGRRTGFFGGRLELR